MLFKIHGNENLQYVDPLAGKYPSLSPYAYCANNPVMFYDPNGEEIRIYYKERKGIGRLFERSKYITYTQGMTYDGGSKFVKDVVNSFNYVYKNNADVHGIIEKSVVSHEVVKVKKGSVDLYDPSKKTISWTTKGLNVWNDSSGELKEGRQSGALGLFHELGHAYRDIFSNDDFINDFNTYDSQYDNVEERMVIENYETPAANILNEGTRNNHSGRLLNTKDPISTQTKRDARAK